MLWNMTKNVAKFNIVFFYFIFPFLVQFRATLLHKYKNIKYTQYYFLVNSLNLLFHWVQNIHIFTHYPLSQFHFLSWTLKLIFTLVFSSKYSSLCLLQAIFHLPLFPYFSTPFLLFFFFLAVRFLPNQKHWYWHF